MHDLLLDLARLVLVDEIIIDVRNQSNSERSCRYALLDDCSKKLESYTDSPAKIRALHFLDCNKIELHNDAFTSAKYLRVLDLSGCAIQRLPHSIGQLKQLRYLNAPRVQHQIIPDCITNLFKLIYLSLSGSSALTALPDSIGQMEGLLYLDLSGCSGLEKLPESFGKLKQLVHLDLSNCSSVIGVSEPLQTLANLEYLNLSYCWNTRELPENLGSFFKLKYLNISGCVEIEELPQSFGNLKRLKHLDLSYCCDVKIIPEVMGSLSKLQYLNLSHCGCIGGNGMAEALGNLSKLRHLHLSGFIDRICDESSFATLHERTSFINTCMESISTLSNLEQLDLSCNEGLLHLPECICSLSNLSTLDLSDCSSMDLVPESIVRMDSLKMIYAKNCSSFVNFIAHGLNKSSNMLPILKVHIDDLKGSKLALFQALDVTRLLINGLGTVKSVEEVQHIKLVGKQGITELIFVWDSGCPERIVGDNEVLGSLQPPRSIEILGIYGYSSVTFPDWLMGISPYKFPNLVSISLSYLPNCTSLPPLGQLANLKELNLSNMQSVTRIGEDICGGAVAFPQLESFFLDTMPNLEVWTTMCSYRGDGMSRYMFPCLRKLNILNCPKLKLKPCPPKAGKWVIKSSDGAISTCGESISQASACTSSSPLVTTLQVHYCDVPMHQWSLLYHLPGLRNLEINTCTDLTSSPEIIRALSSLQGLSLTPYQAKAQLPEWLGHLTSLKKLKTDGFEFDTMQEVAKHLISLQSLELQRYPSMTALPQWMGDLVFLKRLRISICNSLNNLQEIMRLRTSLKKLDIKYCISIKSLPESIQQLTRLEKLRIFSCPALEKWCESEKNQRKLAHIKVIKEDWY